MKVLLISGAFPPLQAGEADHAFLLARKLAEQSLDVDVLTTCESVTAATFPFRLHAIMRSWSWLELPKLIKFLRSSSPDAILLYYSGWLYQNHPMITFIATISKWICPSVVFVTQFGVPEGALPHRKTLLARAVRVAMAQMVHKRDVDYNFGTLLRDSDRVIVLSEYHHTKLEQHFAALGRKSLLLPPPPILNICQAEDGIARRRGRQILHVPPEDFLIAYFGYIYEGKGLETLLRAFRLVRGHKTGVWLALIGGRTNSHNPAPYAEQIEALCRELGITDSVIWSGNYGWNNDEASCLLRAADVGVLPFDEGVTLNRSSLAAVAAHGLPIITTKGAVLESVFKDESNVLLCRPKEPEKLAQAIERVLGSPGLRQTLQRGALDLANDWFSWDRAVERTIDGFKGRAWQ